VPRRPAWLRCAHRGPPHDPAGYARMLLLATRTHQATHVTTLFMAVIVAGYLAFLNGTSRWLISSARHHGRGFGPRNGRRMRSQRSATIALWLTATIRHAFTAPAEPVDMRDVHEVIHPEKAARR
jgi:hypothetical protein